VSYAIKLAAAAILFLIGGVVAILIFEAIWLRIGLGAALVILCGVLILMAWRADRKARASREGLERI
jgi:Flp pilus assembly protein TadB